MKKILCLISLIGIITPTLSNTSFTNYITKNDKNLTKLNAFIPIRLRQYFSYIAPLYPDYCLSASIQMIFYYYGLRTIDQVTINNAVNEGDTGLAPDYLNFQLRNYMPNNIQYSFTNIPERFGETLYEQMQLQHYVSTSINANVPIILGHEETETYGHAIVITGVDINTDCPYNNVYFIRDPDSISCTTITGTELSQLLSRGGEFIGYSPNFDFNKRKISVSPLTADQNLYSYSNKKVGTINTDLTSIGINSIKDFKNEFKSIELPSFRGSVALFSQTVFTNTFNLNTLDYPETYYDWLSGNYEIINKIEDSGAAHIEGRILTQVNFTHIHGHLIFSLILLIGGTSWATQNWAHVWLNSGNLLTFIRK